MDDRISTLPDEVLCHILSFIPTKQAVATSVLSKRWKSLWRSVTTLDFDNTTFPDRRVDYARFVQSVYTFILSRDHHQPIQKFRIRLWGSGTEQRKDPTVVTVWVNFLMQSRIEHLDISLYNHPIQPLPPPILSPVICSWTNLVVLKLQGLSLNPLSSVDFPFLKTLHLRFLDFLGYECLAKLLSRCPLLQELIAKDLFFIHRLPDGSNHETLPVQFLHISQIKLINNTVLHIDESSNYSVFTPLCNLTHVELSCTTFNKDWLKIVEMLKYCPKLQALDITQNHVLLQEKAEFEYRLRDSRRPQSVPKCILHHLKKCYISDYRGTEGEFQFAKYIMRNGKVLKSMTIDHCPMVNQRENHKNLRKLSVCRRGSATCKLSFN